VSSQPRTPLLIAAFAFGERAGATPAAPRVQPFWLRRRRPQVTRTGRANAQPALPAERATFHRTSPSQRVSEGQLHCRAHDSVAFLVDWAAQRCSQSARATSELGTEADCDVSGRHSHLQPRGGRSSPAARCTFAEASARATTVTAAVVVKGGRGATLVPLKNVTRKPLLAKTLTPSQSARRRVPRSENRRGLRRSATRAGSGRGVPAHPVLAAQ